MTHDDIDPREKLRMIEQTDGPLDAGVDAQRGDMAVEAFQCDECDLFPFEPGVEFRDKGEPGAGQIEPAPSDVGFDAGSPMPEEGFVDDIDSSIGGFLDDV